MYIIDENTHYQESPLNRLCKNLALYQNNYQGNYNAQGITKEDIKNILGFNLKINNTILEGIFFDDRGYVNYCLIGNKEWFPILGYIDDSDYYYKCNEILSEDIMDSLSDWIENQIKNDDLSKVYI